MPLGFLDAQGHGCEDVIQANQDAPRGVTGTISVYVGFILGGYVGVVFGDIEVILGSFFDILRSFWTPT